MKRLFNEFSATPFDEPDGNIIRDKISKIFDEIWDRCVVKNDCCPRDVEFLCHSELSCLFSEQILKNAMTKSRKDRLKNP